MSSRSTPASRSTGWIPAREPARFPIGVRTAPTTTASRAAIMAGATRRSALGAGEHRAEGDQRQDRRDAGGDGQDDLAGRDEREHGGPAYRPAANWGEVSSSA